MRAVVGVFGALCVVLVLVVEKLGAVLQLSMSLGSVSNGPLLGIFTIGVLIPWIEGTVTRFDPRLTSFLVQAYFRVPSLEGPSA